MCGITGIYRPGGAVTDKDRAALKVMMAAMSHRGPDGEGAFEHKNCLMGHRRLAIIDLCKGAQPIFNEDRTVCVTYNGEIYNYKELRETLSSAGHRFYTESDTEVINHAYEQWGEDCFLKFNGMFAIALFDKKSETLYLARDRVGMKPLYFLRKDGLLLWSSEIKSMLLHESAGARLNRRTLCDFMTFQNTIDEKTFFEGITKLLPGHFIRAGASLEIKKYWDMEPGESSFSGPGEALAVYEAAFKNSVKRHLESDVEVASYLSGGFDSSSVAWFASRFLDYPLRTFTGYFSGGKKYDERDLTRIFEKIANVNRTEIRITPRDFRENIEKVIYHLDEPTLGTGALPHYMVAKEASKRVKVLLTGHGGDELFAGYQVYKASFYKDLLRNDFPAFLRFFWKNRPDELLKVLYFSLYPLFSEEVKYGLFIMFGKNARKRLFTPDFLDSLGGYSPAENLEEKYLKNKKLSHTDRTLYLYLKTYLPTLFIQEDKVGMAHSLESRMPICDNEMVELSAKIPYRYKLYGNNLKYLTKEMMRKYLPEEYYSHPKMGFPTPVAIWFRKDLKDFVYDALTGKQARERGIFNHKYVKSLLDFHSRFGDDTLYDYVRANKIYSLLSVELWFRNFIDKKDVEISQ